MKVAESKFLILHFFEPKNTVKVQWLPASKNMMPEDFQKQILTEAEVFRKYSPAKVLADTQNLFYTIVATEQEWHNQIIMPIFAEIQLKKLAVLMSKDVFAGFSVNQILDNDTAASYKTRYFNAEADAQKWLDETN